MNNKHMELEYVRVGDYYLPKLEAPEPPQIGKYGRMRENYLKTSRRGLYAGMRNSGKLTPHLEEIDRQAEYMMERLVTQMAKAEGVTELLKVEDQMAWVGRMNSIHQRAEEMVKSELIYT